MPKIRFANLPRFLREHIVERVAEPAISLDDLPRLRSRVNTEPHALLDVHRHQIAISRRRLVQGLRSFILCGTDEYSKTVFKKGMKPFETALQLDTPIGK